MSPNIVRHYFADKGPSSQSYGFSSSYAWMWELDYKESWSPRTDAFELWHWRKLLSPLNSKEIQPVPSKGDPSQTFIGRTDAEAETPICWPPDVTNWLIRKTLMLERLKAGGEGDNRRLNGWNPKFVSLVKWQQLNRLQTRCKTVLVVEVRNLWEDIENELLPAHCLGKQKDKKSQPWNQELSQVGGQVTSSAISPTPLWSRSTKCQQ